MKHLIAGEQVRNVRFCPFEDVLGVGRFFLWLSVVRYSARLVLSSSFFMFCTHPCFLLFSHTHISEAPDVHFRPPPMHQPTTHTHTHIHTHTHTHAHTHTHTHAGHSGGITSLLVPGSGEPNYDYFENNPYATVKQRREATVHSLMEKLQPDMIMLDPTELGTVDKRPSKEKEENTRKAAKVSSFSALHVCMCVCMCVLLSSHRYYTRL
jgi:BING4CT (NUC141) domain